MGLGSIGVVVYDIIARDKTKEGLDSAGARAKNMNKSALMVGAGMTAVGVGAKLMADNINKAYLSFDSAMAEVKSLGGVTVEQMAIMRSSAIEISKELPLSATNVASGFYMMRSAGFEAGRVIAELPAIAEMAVAGNLEMADAVNSVTMVLDTYGERAGTAADITNVLMGTVQGFKTTLPELQMQLSKNVGVAASLGIEFHELAAMSGMLKKEFVNAEEAGTGMKTMLLRFVDPKVQAQLEALGVEVKDANGDFIGMQAVLDSLAIALQSAGGDVEQMAILQKLFGAEGVRAAMSLIRQKDSLAAFSEQVNAGVSVQEALNAVLESTQSQLTIAENKMDAARIQLGEGMAPATIFAANTMALFAGVIEAMPGPLQSLSGSAIIASQSLIAIGPALAGIIPLMNMLKTAHAGAAISARAHTIATHAQTTAQWLLNTSLYACPLVWIVGAIVAVVGVLYLLEKKFGVVTAAVGFLSDAINGIIGFFGNVMDAIRGVAVDTDKLTDANERLLDATEAVEEAERNVELAHELAKAAAEKVTEASANLAEAQLAVAESAREVDKLTEAYEELKSAMDDLEGKTESLDDLHRAERHAIIGLEEAKLNYAEATGKGAKSTKEAKDALKKYNEIVEEHGEKSEKAEKAYEKYEKATLKQSKARAKSSLDVRKAALRIEDAEDRLDDTRKKIIKTEEEVGIADTIYNELIQKNSGETANEVKVQLDKLVADNKSALDTIHTRELELAEAKDIQAARDEDVKMYGEVLDAKKRKTEEVAAEIEIILEGEAKAGESAGRNLIDGIIRGINSMTAGGRIKNALEAQLEEADKQLPHSDAEEGPFSDLEASGKSVVTTFAKGIDSAKGSVGGSFGEAFESTPFAKASAWGSSGNSEKNTYEGDKISIGDISLSRDYDFPALMRDIENYQSKKRVQRGIRTL